MTHCQKIAWLSPTLWPLKDSTKAEVFWLRGGPRGSSSNVLSGLTFSCVTSFSLLLFPSSKVYAHWTICLFPNMLCTLPPLGPCTCPSHCLNALFSISTKWDLACFSKPWSNAFFFFPLKLALISESRINFSISFSLPPEDITTLWFYLVESLLYLTFHVFFFIILSLYP